MPSVLLLHRLPPSKATLSFWSLLGRYQVSIKGFRILHPNVFIFSAHIIQRTVKAADLRIKPHIVLPKEILHVQEWGGVWSCGLNPRSSFNDGASRHVTKESSSSILNLNPGRRNVTPKHVSCLGAIAAPQEVRFLVVFRLSTLWSVESTIESLNTSKFSSFNTFSAGRDSSDGVDYARWSGESGVYWTFSFIAALYAAVESLFVSTIFITFFLLY